MQEADRKDNQIELTLTREPGGLPSMGLHRVGHD